MAYNPPRNFFRHRNPQMMNGNRGRFQGPCNYGNRPPMNQMPDHLNENFQNSPPHWKNPQQNISHNVFQSSPHARFENTPHQITRPNYPTHNGMDNCPINQNRHGNSHRKVPWLLHSSSEDRNLHEYHQPGQPFPSHNSYVPGQALERLDDDYSGMSGSYNTGHYPSQNMFYSEQRGHSDFNRNQSYKRPHPNVNHPPSRKKKTKLDSRDKAENNRYFCDICDRGFKSDEKYKEHTDSHEKCRVEGCNYIAAPKLVNLHYQMQHRTGLAKKIWQLESDEDIKQWISERKRNFPTKERIDQKKREEEERAARGEVLATANFGRMRGKGRNNRRFPERPANHNRHRKDHHSNNVQQSNNSSIVMENAKNGTAKVNNSDPLSMLANDGSDNEKTGALSGHVGDIMTANKANEPLELAGGLGVLASSYGEVSDSDEEEQSKLATAAEKPPVPESESSGTHDDKQKHLKSMTVQRNGAKQRSHRKDKHKNSNKTSPPQKHQSLLQKLLANEIRHERNIILQCVRFVVSNNFLQTSGSLEKQPSLSNEDLSSSVTETKAKSDTTSDENGATDAGNDDDVVDHDAEKMNGSASDKSIPGDSDNLDGTCADDAVNDGYDDYDDNDDESKESVSGCIDDDVWDD